MLIAAKPTPSVMPTKNFPSRVNFSFRGGRLRFHRHLKREGFSSLTSFIELSTASQRIALRKRGSPMEDASPTYAPNPGVRGCGAASDPNPGVRGGGAASDPNLGVRGGGAPSSQ